MAAPLTEGEKKVLALAWHCFVTQPKVCPYLFELYFNPYQSCVMLMRSQVDYQKLAELGNYKNVGSATASFSAAKRKLLAGNPAMNDASPPKPVKANGKKRTEKDDNDDDNNDDEDNTNNAQPPKKKRGRPAGPKKTHSDSQTVTLADQNGDENGEEAPVDIKKEEMEPHATPDDGNVTDELIKGALHYLAEDKGDANGDESDG